MIISFFFFFAKKKTFVILNSCLYLFICYTDKAMEILTAVNAPFVSTVKGTGCFLGETTL